MTWKQLKLAIGSLALLTGELIGVVCVSEAQEPNLANARQADTASQTPNPNQSDAAADDSQDKQVTPENSLGPAFLKNLLADQKSIWSSPAHLRWADGSWLMPLATASGIFFATDKSLATSLSRDPLRVGRYNNVSNYGLGALLAGGAGFYLWGRITHDEHKRETGVLAGEAAIDGYAANEALAYTLGRERPYQDQGNGTFFRGGTSFPSDHSTLAWALASVFAHEYPGPLTEFFAYGVATGVSLSRVAGEEHFPSDVLIGSAIGWFIGREVFRAHHDSELGGAANGDLVAFKHDEQSRDRRHMGTSFVELDSWVYPALMRLAALGYIRTALVGLKPWTRMECARLVEEASEALQQDGSAGKLGADELEAQLQTEFSYELGLLDGGSNFRARVDSVYARAVSISGPALTDGYHFGQTVGYDFGRPFERGFNGQAGGSVSADAGPLTFYVRAEYEHAPSAPAFPNAALDIIALHDGVTLSGAPTGAASTINRPELLDAYAAVNLDNWQLVVGRQSVSWAPGSDSLMWSDNAPPINMIRIVNSEPFSLPGFLQHLGPVRLDQLFGQLADYPGVAGPFTGNLTYVSKPFVYAQKINLRPFSFLEIGIGRRTQIGGKGGNPLTLATLADSYIGLTQPSLHSVPGDTESEFDWTFYVPKVRNYIVLYGDAYAEDDWIPLQNPARNPWNPSLYITRVPGLSKLDFHVEGVSTEQEGGFGCNCNNGNFNYWNGTYREGNTSDGFLLGNTVGRDGRSIQSWLTYWLSSSDTLQFIYRHNTVSGEFIPGGGAWQDYAARSETYLRDGLYIKAEFQLEHISHYPILFDGPQTNVTAILEFGFSPRKDVRGGKHNP